MQGEYLKALGEWSKSLGVEFSNQVGYNMPVDMVSSSSRYRLTRANQEVKQSNIRIVDAPECESLGFNNDIDAYRQYAGPANLAGKRVISSELGADSTFAYQQNFTRLLWEVNRSIVGSVNQFVLHGFPYSGQVSESFPGNHFVEIVACS